MQDLHNNYLFIAWQTWKRKYNEVVNHLKIQNFAKCRWRNHFSFEEIFAYYWHFHLLFIKSQFKKNENMNFINNLKWSIWINEQIFSNCFNNFWLLNGLDEFFIFIPNLTNFNVGYLINLFYLLLVVCLLINTLKLIGLLWRII